MSGLSDLFDFKIFEGKKILNAIKDKPSRLLTGVDPGSTKVWNAVKGSNDDPLVDEWGGTTKKAMGEMDEAGINTGPGRAMEGLAHVIAAMYAGKWAGGKMGFGQAGSTAANTNATNPALIDSAMGTSGYGASSAGAGGEGAGLMSSMDWSKLGQNLQGIGDSGQQQQQPVEQIDLSGLAAAEAARQQELEAIARSSKKAKTPGGGAIDPRHPIDRNGQTIAAIKELKQQIDAARKKLAAIKARKGRK